MIPEDHRDYRRCVHYNCSRVFDNCREKGTHWAYEYYWCDQCIANTILYEKAEQDRLEEQYKSQQEIDGKLK